jgi:hypothetical protein
LSDGILFEKFWMLSCSYVLGNSCCEGKIIMTKEWKTKENNEQEELVS